MTRFDYNTFYDIYVVTTVDMGNSVSCELAQRGSNSLAHQLSVPA